MRGRFPVPADDPAPLVDTLRFYLDGGGVDPHERQRRSAEARERHTAGARPARSRPPGHVHRITTPAWTRLFALASGVVTDVGGPLSHSSIVACEYGIPAVLGTNVPTRRVRDGQLVRVDGDAGTVTLLPDGARRGRCPAAEASPGTAAEPAARRGPGWRTAGPAAVLALGVAVGPAAANPGAERPKRACRMIRTNGRCEA